MRVILKNIGIIALGIIIGMIINMGLIILGGIIIAPSDNFEPMNALNWDLKYFIFPFLAHALGTFSGTFIVSKLSKKTNIAIPLIVGFYFLSGGVYMATILPAPIWFILLDITVGYIPMALLGWKLAK
tara:strand:+ start:459 stop:842 length:384 start_codon:yes stop_codon:yes gene_type:complete